MMTIKSNQTKMARNRSQELGPGVYLSRGKGLANLKCLLDGKGVIVGDKDLTLTTLEPLQKKKLSVVSCAYNSIARNMEVSIVLGLTCQPA